jgi:hypothetical protein
MMEVDCMDDDVDDGGWYCILLLILLTSCAPGYEEAPWTCACYGHVDEAQDWGGALRNQHSSTCTRREARRRRSNICSKQKSCGAVYAKL